MIDIQDQVAIYDAFGYTCSTKKAKPETCKRNNEMNKWKALCWIPLVSIIAAAILLRKSNIMGSAQKKAYLCRIIIAFIPFVNLLLIPTDAISNAVVRPLLEAKLRKLKAPTFNEIQSF